MHTLSLSLPLTATPDVPVDGLIRAAQLGDAEAFASLYDAHAPRVLALCLGLTGDRASAEELTQDTFVRAWQALASFRGDSTFSSWLHRIAVNRMLETERGRRRRSLRVALVSELQSNDAPDSATPVDALAATPDDAQRLDLEAAIARLPEGARTVFVLHDIAGYAHAEVAQQMGIAEGTSKAHLFRARRLLRGMLEP